VSGSCKDHGDFSFVHSWAAPLYAPLDLQSRRATVTWQLSLQVVKVAAALEALEHRSQAESALPSNLVLPYLSLIDRVRLFHDREPQTKLRADLSHAKHAKDTSMAQQLVQELASLGFDEQLHIPSAAELAAEIHMFVSENAERTYSDVFDALQFDRASACNALFKSLSEKESYLLTLQAERDEAAQKVGRSCSQPPCCNRAPLSSPMLPFACLFTQRSQRHVVISDLISLALGSCC
jgi:hypothetical protein